MLKDNSQALDDLHPGMCILLTKIMGRLEGPRGPTWVPQHMLMGLPFIVGPVQLPYVLLRPIEPFDSSDVELLVIDTRNGFGYIECSKEYADAFRTKGSSRPGDAGQAKSRGTGRHESSVIRYFGHAPPGLRRKENPGSGEGDGAPPLPS